MAPLVFLSLGALAAACSQADPAGQTAASAGAQATSGGAGGSAGAAGQTVAGMATSGGAAGAAGQGGQGDGAVGVAGSATVQAGAAGSAGQAGGGVSGGGQGPSGCTGGKVVHFVYFVEADQAFNEQQRNDIEKQAFAFQKYWFEQLGVTFYLNEPVVDVIEAEHDSAWYLTTPDGIHDDARWYRLGNVKNEVYEKLDIEDFDPDHRVVNYPTTRHDGRVGGNFGGAWMDGDDLTCIANSGVNYPYDDGNSAHCLGHVAHEFGHVLGLDHEGPQTDCMQFGFYAPPGGAMCSFSPANVAKIKADPDNAGWFDAMPGQTCQGR